MKYMQRVMKYMSINKVLMNWNPLSVTGPALEDEYIGLIPGILAQSSKRSLSNFLKNRLSTHYGVECEEMDIQERGNFKL